MDFCDNLGILLLACSSKVFLNHLKVQRSLASKEHISKKNCLFFEWLFSKANCLPRVYNISSFVLLQTSFIFIVNPFGDPLYEGTQKLEEYDEEYFIDFQAVPQRGMHCDIEFATKIIRLFV